MPIVATVVAPPPQAAAPADASARALGLARLNHREADYVRAMKRRERADVVRMLEDDTAPAARADRAAAHPGPAEPPARAGAPADLRGAPRRRERQVRRVGARGAAAAARRAAPARAAGGGRRRRRRRRGRARRARRARPRRRRPRARRARCSSWCARRTRARPARRPTASASRGRRARARPRTPCATRSPPRSAGRW